MQQQRTAGVVVSAPTPHEIQSMPRVAARMGSVERSCIREAAGQKP
jgi:hypothetical protein